MDPPLIECLEGSLVGLVIQFSMAAEINKLRAEISCLKHQPKDMGSQRQDEEDISQMSDQMGHLCSFEQKHGGLGGAIWGIIFMQWVGLMASFTLTMWSAMTQFVELELFPNQCLSR
jgi:hypothetical protein